ncbi:MAG TPA: acetate--CoA ligase family protein [Pseudonocardia sp.]|nr:acetate--CoA ligase family protein [Pseudonocardia sp.]
MDLTLMLRPRSIAVVGASPRSFAGQIAVRNCLARGFTGSVVPVHPRHREVAGVSTVASVAVLGEVLEHVPDLVVVQVATERVLGVVAEAAEAGARSFVIPGGGHTDSGAAATALGEGLTKLAASHGVRVVGPNCMGVLDLVSGAAPYLGTVPASVRRGRIGVLSHSGAVVEALVSSGGRVPFSTVVSCGSEVTTTMADYLDFFTADPETDAVLAFVEGFADPGRMLAAVRRFAGAGKTLVACLVGRSAVARRGVLAHSGKLAPKTEVAAAALRQAGAVLATDIDELFAYGELLAAGTRPRGGRMHLVTNSGGEANLLADLAEDAGLTLPPLGPAAVRDLRAKWPRFHVANPLDPWGVDDYALVYPEAFRAIAGEPGDILAAVHDQQAHAGEYEREFGLFLARALASADVEPERVRALISPTSHDPDPVVRSYCQRQGIALLRGARPALAALAGLAGATAPAPVALATPHRHPALAQAAPLTEAEALAVLDDLGIRTPRRVRALDAAEAVEAAASIGGPVVLKGVARGLWHKSELGLVHVGLSGPRAVRLAAEAILRSGAEAGLDLELLVVELVTGSLDVLVGYHRDPQFGSTLLVGLGGVWTESLDRVDLYVGQLDLPAARRFVGASTVGAMARRARGGALDTEPVAAALAALSGLAEAHPEIVSIDINPVMLGRHAAVAVDAAIHRTGDTDNTDNTDNTEER